MFPRQESFATVCSCLFVVTFKNSKKKGIIINSQETGFEVLERFMLKLQ